MRTQFNCDSDDCRATFPMVGGVPVLIDERRSAFSAADCIAAVSIQEPSKTQILKRMLMRWLPALDRNMAGAGNMHKLRELLAPLQRKPVILNIGGKHPSSATARLCDSDDFDTIECDLLFRPRTNLVADPHNLPIADASVDLVLLDAMLEHLFDPFVCVDEIHRVLRPGGLVYADSPFMLQVHGGPLDLLRFSHLGHRRLFRRFEEVASGITAGPGVALAYSAQFFLLSFAQSRLVRSAIEAVCRLTLFWLKYFDVFLRNRPGAYDAAHGVYFIGRSSMDVISDRELVRGYRGATRAFHPLPGNDNS